MTVTVNGKSVHGPAKYLVMGLILIMAPIWLLLLGTILLGAGIAYLVVKLFGGTQ